MSKLTEVQKLMAEASKQYERKMALIYKFKTAKAKIDRKIQTANEKVKQATGYPPKIAQYVMSKLGLIKGGKK